MVFYLIVTGTRFVVNVTLKHADTLQMRSYDRSDKVVYLLGVLKMRGPLAFSTFYDALRATPGQGHLADLLESQLPGHVRPSPNAQQFSVASNQAHG
jgi:hypothetical protein